MAQRINAEQAREHMHSDENALLVCAYDSDQKFEQARLEGAMSLSEFQEQQDNLEKDREIIFYCA